MIDWASLKLVVPCWLSQLFILRRSIWWGQLFIFVCLMFFSSSSPPSFSSHSSPGGAVSLGVATPPPMAASWICARWHSSWVWIGFLSFSKAQVCQGEQAFCYSASLCHCILVNEVSLGRVVGPFDSPSLVTSKLVALVSFWKRPTRKMASHCGPVFPREGEGLVSMVGLTRMSFLFITLLLIKLFA